MTIIPPIVMASMPAAPTVTVLSLLAAVTPTPAATSQPVPGKNLGRRTPAETDLMARILRVFRLPPLPAGWQWGLLLILLVGSLLFAFWRTHVPRPW